MNDAEELRRLLDENAKLRQENQSIGMAAYELGRKSMADENAKMRKLVRRYVEYTSQDRCEGCVCTAQREAELRYNMDNGVPWDQLREDAQTMMEGSIVLWKTILEEVADERSRADGR